MSKEYIERGALKKRLACSPIFMRIRDISFPMKDAVLDLVERQPTADVVEVVHGKWIPIEYDGYADGYPVWYLWECSECREEHRGDEDTLTPYCSNCGAKMDGKDGEGK
jgi:hypothetical protein